jgi:Lipocalin-like domain
MRTLMLLLAIAVGLLALFPAAAEEDLTGTYKLISSKRKIVETGEVLDTWGASPKGFISYGKDGRLLVLIVTDDRPRPESVEKITDQDRTKLFRTMTAYGGTYDFDGKTVRHHIDISWNEVWTGTTVARELRRDGDRLVYSSPAAPFSSDGRMSLVTLVWEKVH